MFERLYALYSRGKNYAKQFVLGHKLLPARPEGCRVTNIDSVLSFENSLDQLLGTYVDRFGHVNYTALVQQPGRQILSNIVQFIAAVSPLTRPEDFKTKEMQLAFYMNAYNALVLWGVVNSWPLKSVRSANVWALIKLAPIQSFFISLHFEFSGKEQVGRGGINLFDLEHGIIRAYGDARIHAAINCASASCPRLRQTAFRAAQLDEQLDSCMVEMITDIKHLRVDDNRNVVTASMIFKWYSSDFVGPNQADSIWDYWQRFLKPQEHPMLLAACKNRYSVEYETYDWQINSQARAQTEAAKASKNVRENYARNEDGSRNIAFKQKKQEL